MMSLLVVNGPNLDRLGSRQTGVYGTQTLSELEGDVARFGEKLGVVVESLHSNHEGELIEALHSAGTEGVILNAGAFAHTSHALADAIRSIAIPVVEVHISNVKEREPWRARSVIADACVTTIYGRGAGGYRDAIRHLVNRAALPVETLRYGPHPENFGDLRRGVAGLVVLIHGGVWRHQYRRDTIESLAVDLTRKGYHTFNIDYRTFGTGGGWPGSGHDVLTALDHVPQLGLGGGPVLVVGHSAGGYLGMWAAARARSPVDLVVGLAPVVDLEEAVSAGGELSGEARLLLEAGAPSPVGPGHVSLVLAHGDRDETVPIGHSRGLAGAHGVDLLEIQGGHFDLLDPAKPHWDWVVGRLPVTG